MNEDKETSLYIISLPFIPYSTQRKRLKLSEEIHNQADDLIKFMIANRALISTDHAELGLYGEAERDQANLLQKEIDARRKAIWDAILAQYPDILELDKSKKGFGKWVQKLERSFYKDKYPDEIVDQLLLHKANNFPDSPRVRTLIFERQLLQGKTPTHYVGGDF